VNLRRVQLYHLKINSDVKVKENGVLEILPDDYNCDGFFIAKLRKLEEKC